MMRWQTFDAIEAEGARRRATKEGCRCCCYCDLGAEDLCRHYDLSLAWLDLEAASDPKGEAQGRTGVSDEGPGTKKETP